MFIIKNTLGTIAGIFHSFISLYMFLILAAAILSWFNIDRTNKFMVILNKLTEPAFAFVRKKFPFTLSAGMDFSPIFLLVLLWLIDGIVIQSLLDIAYAGK